MEMILTIKRCTQAKLNCLKQNWLVVLKWNWITYKRWYAIKPNQPIIWVLLQLGLFNGIPTRVIEFQDILAVRTFLKGICPKVKLIVLMEFDLAYFTVAVRYFSHYAPRVFYGKSFIQYL